MTRGTAAGISFRKAQTKLVPVLTIDGHKIIEGENLGFVPTTSECTLEISDFGVKRSTLLGECGLKDNSRLVVVIDLECSEFKLSTNIFLGDFTDDNDKCVEDGLKFNIPSALIRAGCRFEVQLVLIEAVRISLVACGVIGGILSTWEAHFESKHHGGVFPIQSARVPALWDLRFNIEGVDDLMKPIGAALRVLIDEDHFEKLIGVNATSEVVASSNTWLLVEVLTSIAIATLSNDELVVHFSDKLKILPPVERTMDHRHVEVFLLSLLRGLSSDPSAIADELHDNPFEANRRIREQIVSVVEAVLT